MSMLSHPSDALHSKVTLTAVYRYLYLCSVPGRELVLEIWKLESIELKCPGHTAQKRQGKL